MTHERPIEDRISAWLLEEAPRELPDSVLQATFERTRTRRQRGLGAGWSRPLMPRLVTALAAGAAVVVLVVAGAGLLERPSDPSVGGPATATPSSSTSPTRTVSGASPSPYPLTSVELEGIPVPGAFALDASTDAMWVTSNESLVRIDLATLETRTLDLNMVDANGLRATDTAIWISDYGAGKLHQVDPASMELVETSDLESGAYSIAVDGDELFVVLRDKTLVYDTETMEVVRETTLAGGFPNPFAFGSLWINNVNRVFRVDPVSLEIETTIDVPTPADTCTVWPLDGVDGIGESMVLGCYEGRYLTRIDVGSNAAAGTYDIGFNGGSSVAAAGSWWAPVGRSDAPGLARIDPASGAVVEVLALGANNLTAGMVTTEDALWIAAPDSGQVLRIPLSALER